YIADLARRHGVQVITKSKSMVSEEIGLNHALEADGRRVVETDFGEYVVHLSGARPSHMISPIAHLNRYQVGALLSEDTGETLSGENIQEMTVAARKRLREAFLSAGMGISGANALITESGTMVLVTNEGNAELTTSLPDVHVVITGYEKLIPTFADAMLQLRLLARSGTGQQITSYTTFITGPDHQGKELHYVFVDNGRSEMRADPAFADVLRCIRCGACANVCPPYQVVSGYVFGYIYAGAVGLVTTPYHHGIENDAGPQGLCVQCNACATVCPVEIPLPRQILDTRRKVVQWEGLPWYKRLAFEAWSRPRLFDALSRAASVVQTPLASDGYLRRLPLPESMSWRTPPSLAAVPARDRLIGRRPSPAAEGPIANSAARGLSVAYFIQCVTDRFLPDMAEATVRVIEACGASVVVPADQHCCGLPAYDSGDTAHARGMARQTIRWLEGVQADYVVSGAASCVIMIARDYEHLFEDDPRWKARAARVAGKVVDLTTFLDKVARLEAGALDAGPFYPVTYHYFCQSHNVLGLREEPKRLLTEVMGLEYREMDDASTCCGFGGSVSIDHPEMARHIVERKLNNIDATGAPLVITDNPGCIL
ncbi:MAG TPA: LUD domain-containing protein, partial [Chloroflexota bacterium]